MKKLLTFMVLMSLGCMAVSAAEVAEPANQDTDIDASGVCVVINKQPGGDNSMAQTIKIRRSGLVFVINVNGKIQDQNKAGTESK